MTFILTAKDLPKDPLRSGGLGKIIVVKSLLGNESTLRKILVLYYVYLYIVKHNIPSIENANTTMVNAMTGWMWKIASKGFWSPGWKKNNTFYRLLFCADIC